MRMRCRCHLGNTKYPTQNPFNNQHNALNSPNDTQPKFGNNSLLNLFYAMKGWNKRAMEKLSVKNLRLNQSPMWIYPDNLRKLSKQSIFNLKSCKLAKVRTFYEHYHCHGNAQAQASQDKSGTKRKETQSSRMTPLPLSSSLFLCCCRKQQQQTRHELFYKGITTLTQRNTATLTLKLAHFSRWTSAQLLLEKCWICLMNIIIKLDL